MISLQRQNFKNNLLCLLLQGLFLVIIVSISLFQALSESRDFECKSLVDKNQAEKLLSDLQLSYSKVKNFKSEFSQQSYLASLDITEGSTGKVIFEKPGNMKWIYEKPERQEFLLANSNAYFYQPEQKQLVIDRLDQILLSEIPVAFMMGVGNLKQDFSIDSACKVNQGFLVSLNPTRKTLNLKQLKILIDKNSFYPIGAKVIDESDNVTSVVFSNMIQNSSLENNTFNPDYPSGIDINDRRVN
jgi:outer membrane lipoprotein carrier protein